MPSNRCAVVGPNGCGKSNIIDAVRWVMGESSAKQLRGENITDVIFSGSNSRQPTSQASIELVFDNSDGRIGGEYSAYAEIAIRRQVNRESQSTYFLNGQKCRRRDIHDVFLGTGFGPRSYSIIEQGMISRIIEARPEELRVYLEEAAGISKYKERRRETEHRIRHTRENLERLEDLREEVGKHLKHLQRQANVAERYKRYKEEQRLLEAQLLVLKLQGLEAQGEQEQSVVGERQTVLEAAVAEKRRLEAEIEKTREEHVARLDDVNKVQERYYRLGADIARHEQSVAHARDIRARQEDDLEQTATEIVELRAHINRDESDLVKLVAVLTDLEPSLEQARQRQQAAQQALEEADAAVAEWQEAWNAHNGAVNDARQIAEVERARIEQLESQARCFGQRRERIEEESDSLSVSDIERELMTLEEDDRQQQQRLAGLASELEATLAQLDAERERDQQLTAELDDERSNLQSLRGRLASLEALQQAALGADNETVTRWLENGNYQDAPRLAQKLEVKPGWERAVETVLGDYLEAVCVDGIEPAAALLGELESGAVAFVTGEPASSSASTDRLAAYVSGPAALGSLLNDVFVADSLDAALAMRGRLQSGQSVITADGIWLGSSWLRVNRADDAHAGVIVREKALRELRDGEREVAEGVEALQERHRNTREQIRLLEQQRDDRQLEHNQANRAYADLTARLGGRRLRLD
ncbi:MAG: AAA family ATPase, partial [Pseudomonadota bacterium]